MLDESVLHCLFRPTYMDLALSIKLEAVSKSFLQCSRSFQRNMSHVDLEDFRVFSDKEGLMKKLIKRCTNIENLKDDTRKLGPIGKMINLTHLELTCCKIDQNFVRQLSMLPKLRHLTLECGVKCSNAYSFKTKGAAPHNPPRLCNLESLEVSHYYNLDIAKLCNTASLKIMKLKVNLDKEDKHYEKRVCAIGECTNLEVLRVKLDNCNTFNVSIAEKVAALSRIVDLAHSLPRLQKLQLEVSDYDENDINLLYNLAQNPRICSNVHTLSLLECQYATFGRSEQSDILNALSKFTNLHTLETEFKLNHQLLFEALPLLRVFIIELIDERAHKGYNYTCVRKITHIKCPATLQVNLSIELDFRKGRNDFESVSRKKLISLLMRCGNVIKKITVDDFEEPKLMLNLLKILGQQCPNIREMVIYEVHNLSRNLGLLLATLFKNVQLLHFGVHCDVQINDPLLQNLIGTLRPLVERPNLVRKICLGGYSHQTAIALRQKLQNHPQILAWSIGTRFLFKEFPWTDII